MASPDVEDFEFNITPEEFEKLVYEYLKEIGKNLFDFEVIHNTLIETHDGSFQIDIKATFEALNCYFLVLIECKRHKWPVKREVVQILHDKIQSTGAHKGIIFSTSDFQSGAISYAYSHGISLITVRSGKTGLITDDPIDFRSLRYSCSTVFKEPILYGMKNMDIRKPNNDPEGHNPGQ
ncbi:MAG: restriction endonuclease [Chitinophagaceae bacterium]|nr:restriction endonuclease [Chitinophagaceae bacterium]